MFLDTANVKDIHNYLQTGVFEGVTTNPTLLKRESVQDRFAHLRLIQEAQPGILYLQLHGTKSEEFIEDYAISANELDLTAGFGLKIPINTEGLKAIREIKKQQPSIPILGTAIYSADQALLAAHAGCDFVAPYIKRMEKADLQPLEVVQTVREHIDRENLATKIMGASFESAEQVRETLKAGAHTVTISPQIYLQMAEKDIANQAITVFNDDALSLG